MAIAVSICGKRENKTKKCYMLLKVFYLICVADFLKNPPHNDPVQVRQVFGY